MTTVLAALDGNVADMGKAIAFGVGVGAPADPHEPGAVEYGGTDARPVRQIRQRLAHDRFAPTTALTGTRVMSLAAAT